MAEGSAPRRTALIALAGIVAVSVLQFAVVRATNFGGWDEWLDIDLASRGILSVPYQARPLALLFFLPGAAVWFHGLEGLRWVQLFYLTSTGVLTFLICRRLAGGGDAVAFLAGVTAAIWAPADPLRLDVVLGRGYAGATAGALFATLLLVEGYRAGRTAALLLAGGIAATVVLSSEATAPLLLGAPALLWLIEGDRRIRLRWTMAWALVTLTAAAFMALRLLTSATGSYQTSAIGFDPHPLRVGGRVVALAGYHLMPLFRLPPAEALRPLAAGAVAAFLLAWFLLARTREADEKTSWASLARLGLVGLMAAALGWAGFALSSGIKSGDRTQFLSSPGVGLLLAVVARALAIPLSGLGRTLAFGACGAWIVGLAAGRTGALQREWDKTSMWASQNASLVQLTELVPRTEPNTLIVLIDEPGTWAANFAFRHAIEYLYDREAKGWVPGAHESYLYPAFLTRGGLRYEPWPVLREAWHAPVSEHRYDEMIVVRLAVDGRLGIMETWPQGFLRPLPEGTRYAPRLRILPPGEPLASRKILRRE